MPHNSSDARRRIAPAASMIIATLGAVALLVTLILQLSHEAAARAAKNDIERATAEIHEGIAAAPGLLTGVLTNDTPRLDTLEVLELTSAGAAAYALTTLDDVLVIGVKTPTGHAAATSNPGDAQNSLHVTLPGEAAPQAFELDVRRTADGYDHTFTAH